MLRAVGSKSEWNKAHDTNVYNVMVMQREWQFSYYLRVSNTNKTKQNKNYLVTFTFY